MTDITSEVLNATSQKLCVIAGPGCRKTTGILIPKAQQVLSNINVNPKNVLLLTFSRPSALDLKDKVKDFDRVPRASTVHSFCLALLLSENNHSIRSRVESILLDFEKEILLSDLKVIFPKEKRHELREKLKEFSAGWATEPHDKVFEQTAEQRAFKQTVANWLNEFEACMMEEIVYHAVDLAKQLPDAKVLKDPQFIFVDEFQDLNRLEQEFITLLAADSQLLLVVGDPDQSIYSFKYAYPIGITDFANSDGVQKFASLVTWRCPKRIVEVANQLLLQADPTRTDLLTTAPEATDGEIYFVRKEVQHEEFDYVLKSIAQKLTGSKPKEILVLVPRRKLGSEFVQYAELQKSKLGIVQSVHFCFTAKHEFNETEKHSILLWSLLAKPNTVVHWRACLGFGDDTHFAKEILLLKAKYGSLKNALEKASADDFPHKRKRVRAICERLQQLKEFVETHAEAQIGSVLDELFPENSRHVSDLRRIVLSLKEEDDTASSLYDKFVDYIRTVPVDDNAVRVMTLIGSKGLDAEHVFIISCNDGNLPGERRAEHMSDAEHKYEQRRLLYVGFTRAKKSLSVSWSRRIPFSQSKGHSTPTVRTVRYNGQLVGEVGLSEFLLDLRVKWE